MHGFTLIETETDKDRWKAVIELIDDWAELKAMGDLVEKYC